MGFPLFLSYSTHPALLSICVDLSYPPHTRKAGRDLHVSRIAQHQASHFNKCWLHKWIKCPLLCSEYQDWMIPIYEKHTDPKRVSASINAPSFFPRISPKWTVLSYSSEGCTDLANTSCK